MALDRAGRRPRDPVPAQRLAGCGCHGDGDAAPSFFFLDSLCRLLGALTADPVGSPGRKGI